MSGIAPLSGPTTTTAPPPGVASTTPGTNTPAAPPQTPPPQKTDGAQNFTAFPSSYAGFGANGSDFGTLSVVNGGCR